MSTARTSPLLWIALALFAALVWVVAARPLWHDDIFWHLRTAELIVQTGHVPRVDLFTHTVYGQPWTSHEWGFALLLFGVYRLGGYALLVQLMSLVTLLCFGCVFLHMRRNLTAQRTFIALPLLMLGLFAASPSCLVLRAALLSSLFLALLNYLLQRLHAEQGPGVNRFSAAICALMVIWANCHGAAVFGLVVLGWHLLQAVVLHWRLHAGDGVAGLLRGLPRQRALLLLSCAGLSLVNPNGFDLWTFSFRVNKLFYASGLTYDMGQYRSPALSRYPCFYLLVALVMLACLPLSRLIAQLKDPQRPVLAQGLGMLFFLAAALRSNRFVLDFVVMALPFFAFMWGGVVQPTAAEDAERERPQEHALLAARFQPWLHAANLLCVLLVAAFVQPMCPERALARTVPQELAVFMQKEQLQGRMFNYEASGGYLGWRVRQPVYWDGRNDIFGPIAKEYAYSDDFSQLVTGHKLDILVLDAPYHARLRGYLASHRDSWGLVYWDDYNALYLKRVPKFQSLLSRHEYKLLQAFSLPAEADLQRLASDPALHAQVVLEARRALSDNRDVFAACYMLGELAYLQGQVQLAHGYLIRAVKLQDSAEANYALARVERDLGHEVEARRLLAHAIRLKRG